MRMFINSNKADSGVIILSNRTCAKFIAVLARSLATTQFHRVTQSIKPFLWDLCALTSSGFFYLLDYFRVCAINIIFSVFPYEKKRSIDVSSYERVGYWTVPSASSLSLIRVTGRGNDAAVCISSVKCLCASNPFSMI